MAEETVVTAPAADPLPAVVETQVIQQLTAALSSQYGQALTDLVVILYPGIKNLALTEIPALIESLKNKQTDEAINLLYGKMSNEDLVAAKAKLLPILRELADKNSAFFDVLHQMFVKAIQLGLSFALTGVLL
jgi:hypothetical protein